MLHQADFCRPICGSMLVIIKRVNSIPVVTTPKSGCGTAVDPIGLQPESERIAHTRDDNDVVRGEIAIEADGRRHRDPATSAEAYDLDLKRIVRRPEPNLATVGEILSPDGVPWLDAEPS